MWDKKAGDWVTGGFCSSRLLLTVLVIYYDKLSVFLEGHDILSIDLIYFIVRVIFPVGLAGIFFVLIWYFHKDVISGKPRTYVAFASLCFFYGICNIFADAFQKYPEFKLRFSLTTAPNLISHFLHKEADNILLFTVGVAIFLAVDAITVTRNDIEESQRKVLEAIGKLPGGSHSPPANRRPWFWWPFR